jgi:hypothetical protein
MDDSISATLMDVKHPTEVETRNHVHQEKKSDASSTW